MAETLSIIADAETSLLPDQEVPQRRGPAGIGGWLILVLLELWISAAARLAAGIPRIIAYFGIAGVHLNRTPAGLLPAVTNIVFGCFGAVAGYLLARKRPKGLIFAKILLLIDTGFYAMSLFSVLVATGPAVSTLLPVWLKPAAILTASALCVFYLFRSRRIVNTFFAKSAAVSVPDKPDDPRIVRIRTWEEFTPSSPPDVSGEIDPRIERIRPWAEVRHPRLPAEPGQPQTEPQTEQLTPPRERGPLRRAAQVEETRPAPKTADGKSWSWPPESGSASEPSPQPQAQAHPEVPHPWVQAEEPWPPAEEPQAWPPPEELRLAPQAEESESAPDTEPLLPAPQALEPEPQSELQAQPELQAEPQQELAPEPELPAEPELQAEPQLQAEPEFQTEPELELAPEPESLQQPAPQAEEFQLAAEAEELQPAPEAVPEAEDRVAIPQAAEPQPESEPEPEHAELHPPTLHAEELQLEPVAEQPAPEPQPAPEQLAPPVPDLNELTTSKAQITDGVAAWFSSPAINTTHGAFLRAARASGELDAIHDTLLRQVTEICDHVGSVHLGQFPTLPNTADANGSLSKEMQKWASAEAVLRLTRSMDIRAAMQINGPFENLIQNRDYLLAIVGENLSDDGFGKKLALADYAASSAPEIAFSLILQAQRDMYEAEMWAQVTSLAGDPSFLHTFANAASTAFQASLAGWRARLDPTHQDEGQLRPLGV